MNFMRIQLGHAGVGDCARDKTFVYNSNEIDPLKGNGAISQTCQNEEEIRSGDKLWRLV